MPTLTLSPSHEYSLDGRPILGVSKILSAAGLVDTTWLSEDAAFRGTLVHKTVELYVKDDLDEASLDPRLAGYLEGYRRFERESGFVVAIVEGVYQTELSMYHAVYGYAGTPDLYGSIGARRIVVDVKSGDPQAWHGDQLAFYSMLFDPDRPDRANLYLRPDGTYRFDKHTGREDFDNAKAALAIARLRIARGLVKENVL
jgi:hypothetical protein